MLYKNIPLPIDIRKIKTYITIAPISDYIAIEKSLSQTGVSKCKKPQICQSVLMITITPCEFTIFRKLVLLPDSCYLCNVNFNFSIWHRLEDTYQNFFPQFNAAINWII